ncbi:sensor histidine kinase [Brachybacterium sp. JB7]|uniref:sensor histidine kinase n=1 Tax=Brachybacterium sp. JB7 TaxID=2024478 RepID=UPI000DF2D7F2|nr:sensor histidine kinase [Brachybacterium sp. JB7]RCS65017.1 sensor histidine kinase [Brachybacterium sp. JB7]
MNTMTMSPPAETPPVQRWSARRWATRIGLFLAYAFVSLVLGALGFSIVLTLLAAGAGTVVIWIGLPILVGGVLTAHGFATVGRALGSSLLGADLPRPAPKQAPEGAGRARRLVTPLTDPQSWLDALWILANFLLVLITFPLALTWAVGSLAIIGGPVSTLVLDRVLPEDDVNGLGALLGAPEQYQLALDIVLQVAMGLFFLLTVGLLVRGLRAAHRGLAHGLLSSRYETQQRLLRTQESRAAGRAAESTALRRLERDLHDGPQQRLVRATMDLARAESLAAENPEKAGEVMRQTREQLGLTLDDLRRLSRGIAPPILVDRGLAAALTELAAISPLPATVQCRDVELPEHVEIGIYYVVSESLTNAAKHSGAQQVHVDVARIGDDAQVRIQDDGRGGAEMRTGGGLAGLAGRVASLEGTFTVTSPVGRGTQVEAVIPCAS